MVQRRGNKKRTKKISTIGKPQNEKAGSNSPEEMGEKEVWR